MWKTDEGHNASIDQTILAAVRDIEGKSKPPQDEGEAKLKRIFRELRSTKNFIEKRKIAKGVLRGEYGIKNELLAKFMLGPMEFNEILEDKRDIGLPLLELLGEKNEKVRMKIVKMLGERGNEKVPPKMYSGLDEEKYALRYGYACALGRMSRNIKDEKVLREMEGVLAAREDKAGISGGLILVRQRLQELSGANDRKGIPAKLRIGGGSGAPGRRGDKTNPMFETMVGVVEKNLRR